MTITILAALDKGSEQWDPQALGLQIRAETKAAMLYKRVNELRMAVELINTEDRWKDLRFLIVSHGSVLNSFDLENGTVGVTELITKVKEKYAFSRYELIVIGVSIDDNFGRALMRYGCDVTCASSKLTEVILELLQPRSGRTKLPDDL